MIELQKMYHHNGKIVIQNKEGIWFELNCVTSDLVTDTFGDVIAQRIEDPTKEVENPG